MVFITLTYASDESRSNPCTINVDHIIMFTTEQYLSGKQVISGACLLLTENRTRVVRETIAEVGEAIIQANIAEWTTQYRLQRFVQVHGT